MNQKKWSFWIDRGGTFTDIVAKSPKNKIFVKKFLSQNDKVYKDAASFGILNILDEYNQLNNNISSCVDEINMGTTVATNALLERKGEKTLLVRFEVKFCIYLFNTGDKYASATVVSPLHTIFTNGDTFELTEIWSNPIFKAIFSINSSCFLNL